jgi:hypothetical protein
LKVFSFETGTVKQHILWKRDLEKLIKGQNLTKAQLIGMKLGKLFSHYYSWDNVSAVEQKHRESRVCRQWQRAMLECNGSGKVHWAMLWTTENKMTYRPLLCEKEVELVIAITQLHCVFNTVFQGNTSKPNVTYQNIIDDMTKAAFYKVTNHLSLGVASKHQVEERQYHALYNWIQNTLFECVI